jgi:CheY-like chemotaxis protein
MEFYGYRVITAASGEEALGVYRQSAAEIEVILLDISMPGMGGLKCLEELLKINPEVRVIMASGYFADGLEDDRLQQGASAVLNKPFRVEALLDKIRSAMDQ